MAERLEFEAGFKDKASPGVKKLGKVLADLKPSHGMVQTQKWFSDFRHGADQTVKAIRPVTGMMNSIGVGGLAASLSIGEMVKQFKELADSTLTMKELGRQAGMSATEIARLQYMASRLHVDPAAMNGAISSWSSKMVDFRRHVGDFYKYLQFNKNGDIAAKIIGENPEQGFKDTLDYLSRIPAAAMKAGKSAADAVQIQKLVAEQAGLGDLVPMLGKGPQGLAEAFAEAGREVKPISKEMQEAADRFNNATTRFNQTWSNFKNDLGPSVLEPLSTLLDKLDGVLKLAAAHPAEAAATAGAGALGAVALYTRYRAMRRDLSQGWASLTRGAEPLAAAAAKQESAGVSLMEAATALKEAAAELRGKGGGGGGGPGGSPEEKGSKGGEDEPGFSLKGPGFTGLIPRGFMTAIQLYNLTKDLPNQIQMLPRGRTKDDAYAPPQVPTSALSADSYWERKNAYLAARNPFHPDDDDRLSRARAGDFSRALNTDGNALHRHDDELSPVTAQEMFQKVREGSKEGIVAGLREMAQEQALAKSGGAGVGADGGTPSLRYGRGVGGGYRSTPGSEGGAPLGHGAVGGTFKGGRTPQAALAKESYDFWRGKGLDHNAALSMVAQEQGESGFDFRNKSGDGGSAHGAFQWHADRRAAILRGTGINIDNADHKQQLEAAWFEGTKGERAGFFQSLNGRTLPDAVRQGVHRFEGSANQQADSAKRLGMARAWDGGGSFLAPKPAVPADASGGSKGAYPDWMDERSRREMAGINAPLARDLLAASAATGTHFRILQGMRSAEEAAQNARTGRGVANSQHRWGAAADVKLTDAAGHDLDRNDPAYEQYANAFEAHSRAAGGRGRWLGHVPGWSWDRAHFDQGIGYGQSHARDPYGAGGPTPDDIRKGNEEIYRSSDNPFTKAAKPLGDATQKLSQALKPVPNLVQMARGDVGRGPEMDPLEVNIRHHPHTGRPIVTARAGKGVKLAIKTAPTMLPT